MSEDPTTRLVKQLEVALGLGAGDATLGSFKAVSEEAAELGARRALARLGLADEAARDDMNELRELLRAWRDAKSSARAAVVEWLVRGLLALLLIGLTLKLGLFALIHR